MIFIACSLAHKAKRLREKKEGHGFHAKTRKPKAAAAGLTEEQLAQEANLKANRKRNRDLLSEMGMACAWLFAGIFFS